MPSKLSVKKAKVIPRLLAGFFLLATCHAQEFWSKEQIALQSLNAGLRVTDSIATCRALAAGGQEKWLPTQSCAGSTAFIAGGIVGSVGLSWLAHKTGHHKLEKMIPAMLAASDGAALGFTLHSWGGFPTSSKRRNVRLAGLNVSTNAP